MSLFQNEDYIETDEQLQSILDRSFNEYNNNSYSNLLNDITRCNHTQNHNNSILNNINSRIEYINHFIDNIEETRINSNTRTEISNIFNYSIKIDECTICTEKNKLLKCHSCEGYYCDICLKKIYIDTQKCAYCNTKLNIENLKNENIKEYDNYIFELKQVREIEIENERKSKEENERKLREENERKSREENERKSREENERKLKEENERKLREENERRKLREENERKLREENELKKFSLLYLESDYDSNSDEIEELVYDEHIHANCFNYKNNKYGFTTSLYKHQIIIRSNNKYYYDIYLPKEFYNIKYLHLLYLILLEINKNKELWNGFAIDLKTQLKSEIFIKHKNKKKHYLWNKLEEIFH